MTGAHGKPNIAIIIPGGIGTGRDNIGVPVLERIVRLLAADYNITVFQLFPVNAGYSVTGYTLIDRYSPNSILKIIKFLIAFYKANRLNNFHTVHGFWAFPCGFLAVIVGKVFKIKSVVSVLGGDAVALPAIHYGQLRNPIYKRLILWTLQQAGEVSALTQYLITKLSEAGLKRSDIKKIPWGIDTTLFSFCEKPLHDPVQFLHIANLHPVKDQSTLLRSFKIISDKIPARLTIIGEGISNDAVKSLIHELKLENLVTVFGLIPYENLPTYYHNADILLHTSLSEGQCEVVTEAMSCGVAVCGTDVGLIYDLKEFCVSVPTGDYTLLALECIRLVNDPERFHKFIHNAHRWTTEHSIIWTAEKIKELYTCGQSC